MDLSNKEATFDQAKPRTDSKALSGINGLSYTAIFVHGATSTERAAKAANGKCERVQEDPKSFVPSGAAFTF